MDGFLIIIGGIAIFAIGAAIYFKYKEKHP
jgi:hypothetical protein